MHYKRTSPRVLYNTTVRYSFVVDSTPFTLVDSVAGMDDFNSGPGVCNFTQSHLLKPSELTRKLPLDVVQASQPMLSCGITNGSTCADQTQMVSEPWASGLCVLVFWCRDAGPSLAENVTCSEMDYTLDEENAAAAYYDNEEDYRTFHYLGNQMKVKRQQAEAA